MNKSVPPTMATKHIYNEIMIEKKNPVKTSFDSSTWQQTSTTPAKRIDVCTTLSWLDQRYYTAARTPTWAFIIIVINSLHPIPKNIFRSALTKLQPHKELMADMAYVVSKVHAYNIVITIIVRCWEKRSVFAQLSCID